MGSTEKVEYRCTTTNLPLRNDTITFLKITLLHSVSIITNSVIPKRDKKQTKQKKKRSHFFVYSRCATNDLHHTWHGDRGGLYHFCTLVTPLTFLIRSVVSPLGAIENLWENSPPTENAYNLVVCPPKGTKLKT